MKVFVTGSTGFVGTAVISELVNAGHSIIALARSDSAAAKVKAIAPEAKIIRGTLDDLNALRSGANESDGIIHLGFVHDFNNYLLCVEKDREAVVAMLEAIQGTDKIFVGTSVIAGLPTDKLATEDDASSCPRGKTEKMAFAYNSKGIRVTTVRLPPTVHGKGDKAFIPYLMQVAKDTGKSCFIDDGSNHWSAVHRLDAAKLFRIVLEKGQGGKVYHSVAEQEIKTESIAKVIGEILDLPVLSIAKSEAEKHFGPIGMFFAEDDGASSKKTQAELGWMPTNVGLFEDMRKNYTL